MKEKEVVVQRAWNEQLSTLAHLCSKRKEFISKLQPVYSVQPQAQNLRSFYVSGVIMLARNGLKSSHQLATHYSKK